jgi:hypothetical protein
VKSDHFKGFTLSQNNENAEKGAHFSKQQSKNPNFKEYLLRADP